MKKGTKKGPNFSSNTEKRDPEQKKRTLKGLFFSGTRVGSTANGTDLTEIHNAYVTVSDVLNRRRFTHFSM